MSLKNLFSKKVLPASSIDDVGDEVESKRFVDAKEQSFEEYIPHVDYSNPANFSFYGSARQYYEDATEHILVTYPYDGSRTERLEWELSASALDLWILENKWPRTAGHIQFGAGVGWGDQTSISDGYGNPETKEYIYIKGGPNVDNIFDQSNSRESNLKLDGATGNTVEFWLKKGVTLEGGTTNREVIFDVYNTGSSEGNPDYGRFRVEVSGSVPFLISYESGSAGFVDAQLGSGIGGNMTDGEWHHYAIVAFNTGSTVETVLYVDGEYNDSFTSGSVVNYLSGAMVATIGALAAAPSGSATPGLGWGKMSGSLDEFRFWTAKRAAKEIGRYYRTQVGGGTNIDEANTALGVYYKFNEGISGNSTTDAVVLDYSGRVSNGAWTGYANGLRHTASAMIDSLAAENEFLDPILRSTNNEVVTLRANLYESGTAHDMQNPASLYGSVPSWITEDEFELDGKSLKKLVQIMASYFDTAQLQIRDMPHLKNADYSTSSAALSPFNDRNLMHHGFNTQELFADSTALERYLNRTETELFEAQLEDAKRRIYENIYNNLTHIYKSKGTDKAFRNLLRCFGINSDVVDLVIYPNNTEFRIEDTYTTHAHKTKFINFNDADRHDSTIYQQTSSAGDADQGNYLSASFDDATSFTVETHIIFPKKGSPADTNYLDYRQHTSSLFGMHTARADEGDLEWATSDDATFQVHVTRDVLTHDPISGLGLTERDVRFVFTSSVNGIPTLTSDLFAEVYDNNRWAVSVSMRPQEWPFAAEANNNTNQPYIVEFYGVNVIQDTVQNSFFVTGSVPYASGSAFMTAHKRLYAGAHYQDFTGSLIDQTDVKLGQVAAWLDYIPTGTVLYHAYNPAHYGRRQPDQNAYVYENTGDIYIPRNDTIALLWDFNNITGSGESSDGLPTTSDATFVVDDMISGSVATGARYGWVGDIVSKQYPGKGDLFLPNDDVASTEYLHALRMSFPEELQNTSLIKILEQDDLAFTRDSLPINYFFSLEKSMQRVISREMMKMFATVKDFSNLIGEPVNKYRHSYKAMEKLRVRFFETVNNTPDMETFFTFYRWIDSAVSQMVTELVPASARFSDKIGNIIESHVLERSKYVHKFPTLELKTSDPEGGLVGINRHLYNWKEGHAPLSGEQNDNGYWWWQQARRNNETFEDTAIHQAHRKLYFSSSLDALERSWTTPYKYSADGETMYNLVGGVNYHRNKKPNLVIDEVRSGKTLTISSPAYTAERSDNNDEDSKRVAPNKKFAVPVKPDILVAQINPTGHDEYLQGKHLILAPFKIQPMLQADAGGYSEQVISGSLAQDREIGPYQIPNIVNLHNNVAGHNEVPMQSPFTREYNGGWTHRNQDHETRLTVVTGDPLDGRIEAWHLELVGGTGSFSQPHNRMAKTRWNGPSTHVNIRNIKTVQSAYPEMGNYSNQYEFFQTTGRKFQNRAFVKSEGFTYQAAESLFVSGIIDFTLPDRTGSTNQHIFVERFSAPGGAEVLSLGFLDFISGEYAVHNALPWRNLTVREALNSWHGDHANQFGYYSDYRTAEDFENASWSPTYNGFSASATAANYDGMASYHKVNRNSQHRLSLIDELSEDTQIVQKYDNWFIQHAIPASDIQYAWITASAETFLGFSTNNPVPSAYVTGSGIVFSSHSHVETNDGLLHVDYVGLNTLVHQSILTDNITLAGPSGSQTDLSEFNNPTIGTLEATPEDLLNGLISHRQGPYGWPSWKQIRPTHNALVRHLRKNNKLALVTGKQSKNTKGIVEQSVSLYDEPAVTFRNLVMTHEMKVADEQGRLNDFEIDHTYANMLQSFANTELVNGLNTHISPDQTVYEDLKQIYLDETIDETTPQLSKITYRDTIYPREINVGLENTRARTNYEVTWWSASVIDRQEIDLVNSFGETVTKSSIWPLDPRANYTTTSSHAFAGEDGAGSLLNIHTIYHGGTPGDMIPGPLYCRPFSGSFVATGANVLWNGAFWDLTRTPTVHYDTYREHLDSLVVDQSLIPEYIMSKHVDDMIASNNNKYVDGFLTLSGAADLDASDQTGFYNTYSNSDFMKHIAEIVDDHKDSIIKPTQLTLRCKATKKFIPYHGFYPVQRTLDLAKLFHDDYLSTRVDVINWDGFEKRTLSKPFFTPGILYNSIKAGMAVDWPVFTSDPTDSFKEMPTDSGNYHLWGITSSTEASWGDNRYNDRLPFESLLTPENYIPNLLYDDEPDPNAQGAYFTSVNWEQRGNVSSKKYKLAINNFLAETMNMFLAKGRPTVLVSKAENDTNFGIVQPSTTYKLRIYLANTPSRALSAWPNRFTTYKQAGAFGIPLQYGATDAALGLGYHGHTPVTYNMIDPSQGGNKFGDSIYPSYGYVDIEFTSDSSTSKYTLDQILNGSTKTYRRAPTDTSDYGISTGDKSVMQITGSLVIDKTLNISTNEYNALTGLPEVTKNSTTAVRAWAIHPRFETPMLNFASITNVNPPDTVPNFGSAYAGMWHQQGVYEADADENAGIFITIADVTGSESLADVVGFQKNTAVRLGRVPQDGQRCLAEAIVAVPFVEEHRTKSFINIDRRYIDNAEVMIVGNQLPESFKLFRPEPSTVDMVKKMQKYVIPPHMDFLKDKTISPFVMYMFEFEQKLTQTDLLNIWQNSSPEIHDTLEFVEASISHSTLKGQFIKNNKIADNVRWMVFKVKKRAATNYEAIIDPSKDRFATTFDIDGDGKIDDNLATYNWPHDFYSLIEYAKIEAEVELRPTKESLQEDPDTGEVVEVTTPETAAPTTKPRVTPRLTPPTNNFVDTTLVNTVTPVPLASVIETLPTAPIGGLLPSVQQEFQNELSNSTVGNIAATVTTKKKSKKKKSNVPGGTVSVNPNKGIKGNILK